MKYCLSCIKGGLFLAAVFFASTASSAETSPFSVEAANLPKVAFAAFEKQFPEVSQHDLGLATPVFFNCTAGRDITWPIGVENAAFNCMATINFDVSATSVEHLYADAQGNCLVLNPPGVASVHIRSDGSVLTHFHRGRDDQGRVVECDDAVITHIAQLAQGTTGPKGVFKVNPRPLMEIAFLAAIEDFEEIPEDKIVYGDGPDLSVSCDTELKVDARTPLDVKIGPCRASIMLANESVMLEYRYISEFNCMMGKATDWIVVEIDEFGLAETRARHNSGGGFARGVECDDAFFDSPLPLIDSPGSTDQH